jgi:hypothetical protein
LTQGSDPNQYTAKELVAFFNRYLLQENQITDAFMTQIMKVKVLAIGGSASAFTRSEIAAAHTLLTAVGQEAQNLNGYWKIFMFTQDAAHFSDKRLSQAQDLMKKAMEHLIGISNAPQSNYSWSDFENLVNEAEIFLQAKNEFKLIKTWMPIVNAVHTLFMGDATNTKTMKGWLQIGDWTTDAYALMARFHYELTGLDFSKDDSWLKAIQFADGALTLLSTSPEMANQGLLKASDIDNVVDEILKLKLIQGDLTADIAKETYRHALVILKQGEELKDTPLADWKLVAGFDTDIFASLQFEYSAWKLAQLESIQILKASNDKVSFKDLSTQLQNKDVTSAIQGLGLSAAQIPLMQNAWHNWLKILASEYPLIYENGAHLIVPATTSASSTIISITLVNTLRALVRFTEMGYGKPAHAGATDVWNGVFSEDGIRQWESDFEKFGRAVHFLDPRQPDSGGLAYMNSRYFTFASNGSTLESSQQLLELLALMVSGGKVVADQMMVDLKQDGCLLSQTDGSFHEPVAEQVCFEKSFKKNFAKLFSSLPALQGDVNSGHLKLDDMIGQLEIISNDNAKTKGTIEYPEMRVMAGVLYYLESLMVVYDKNHDQELDMNEVLDAYPRFEAMVKQMSPIGSTLDEDAYLYIVYKGQKPSVSGVGGAISAAWDFSGFVIERNRENLGQVTRLNLLKVIAVLKVQADATAAAAGANPSPSPNPGANPTSTANLSIQ